MPVTINSMIVSLGLALTARPFDSTALIKVRKFGVTGTAAITIMLYWTMQHVACEEIARCSCTAPVSFALPDPALPTQVGLNTRVNRSIWQGQLS
jgi:hypothetical protein